MELLNRDILKDYIDLIQKQKKGFNIEVLKSISGLTDSEVLFLLCNNMLVLDKFKKGLLNSDSVSKMVNLAAASSAEGKVLKSHYEYLIGQINKSDGLDKIPFLSSMKSFIE